jgi:hypothetical protein
MLIVSGMVSVSGIPRVQTLKHARDIAQASLDRIATQAKNVAEITPEKI